LDLRQQLLRLVAPTQLGESIAPGIELLDASTELGLRLTLQTSRGIVHVEVRPPEPGRRFARQTGRWALSYRAGPDVDGAHAMEVTEAVAVAIARNEAAAPVRGGDVVDRIRTVQVDRILEPNAGFSTLSPYVGCLIGCRFCYAQSRLMPLRTRLGYPDVPWGSWVDVRVNAAERLREELAGRPVTPIKLCPIVSDPYHAVERRFRLTRACLEAIADVAPTTPVLILTRSDAILDDLDLLRRLPAVWAGMSLPSADADVLAHFEPRAATPERRREVLLALCDAGVRTFAVAQPMLPGSFDAHLAMLAETVTSVSLGVLHGVENAGAQFEDARWSEAGDDAWQSARAQQLRAALAAAGVAVWSGELPPDLAAAGPSGVGDG
jgi:DNA repair photolyase